MNVLVTGGTGFVGTAMRDTQPPGLDVTYGGSKHAIASKYECVVHLAPIAPDESLRACTKRSLYCSSGAARYRLTDYGRNKAAWEKQCLDTMRECVVARLFSSVGPRLQRHAVWEFIQQAKQGEIIVQSSGDSVRSYLYADDLGRWMWRLLLDGKSGETYDVGGATPYTIWQVAREVQKQIPCRILTLHNPETPSYYVPDVRKAVELGCVETIGLAEGIQRTK